MPNILSTSTSAGNPTFRSQWIDLVKSFWVLILQCKNMNSSKSLVASVCWNIRKIRKGQIVHFIMGLWLSICIVLSVSYFFVGILFSIFEVSKTSHTIMETKKVGMIRPILNECNYYETYLNYTYLFNFSDLSYGNRLHVTC